MSNKAQVSISRVSSNMEDDYMRISIEDAASGLKVAEVKMSLKEFAKCLTGLSGADAEITHVVSSRKIDYVGCEKVVERIWCEKVSHDKEIMREYVLKHFKDHYAEDWQLWDDGTGGQQNSTHHVYVIYKYVPVGVGDKYGI